MRRLFPLLLVCLLLCGCTAHDPLLPMTSAAVQGASDIPAPQDDGLAAHDRTATIWYRFGTEPLLAPEVRELHLTPTTPYELALMQALLSGPAASSTELSGLFPPGTRVLSTYRQGRLLFVTLSRQILNKYPDEPDAWRASDLWQEEAILRRRLAMQAIAATITENCDVDQVVILVEQTAAVSDSMRLRQSYYGEGDDSAPAAPLTRDENLLLTPHTAMETILQCWAERNWQRLYLYIHRTDPATGVERPSYEDFAAQMDALPHLTSSAFSGGSISRSGTQAVFTFDAQLMDDGQTAEIRGAVMRLSLDRGVWRIGVSQLLDREVIQP